MGFNRPEAKRLAKAAMRNTNPNPMLVTLVFVLLTTGVSYLVEIGRASCRERVSSFV